MDDKHRPEHDRHPSTADGDAHRPSKATHLPTTVTDTAHSNRDEFVYPTARRPGVDPLMLADQLGHTTLTMVRRYIQLSGQKQAGRWDRIWTEW